jgi:hypothetical protein
VVDLGDSLLRVRKLRRELRSFERHGCTLGIVLVIGVRAFRGGKHGVEALLQSSHLGSAALSFRAKNVCWAGHPLTLSLLAVPAPHRHV